MVVSSTGPGSNLVAHVCWSDMLLQKPVGTRRVFQANAPFLCSSFNKSPLHLCESTTDECVVSHFLSHNLSQSLGGMWLAVRSPGDIDANLSLCAACLWGCSVSGGFKAVDRFNNNCDCADSSLFPDLSILSPMLHSSSLF